MINSPDTQILDPAIAALKAQTGIELRLQAAVAEGVDYLLAASFQVGIIPAEIKQNLRPANLGALIHRMKYLGAEALLVADYVNPVIANTLRENRIWFIDSCGNGFIDCPPVYINISGQKQNASATVSLNKAFDTSGLKLVYGLLCDSKLVSSSYRDIAQKTSVALGNIGKVLGDLREAGFLMETGSGERKLINKSKLLIRWVESYPERLRPKLFIGEFVSDKTDWWKDITIEDFGGYWSGEVGAAKYNRYLIPQATTLYLPEQAKTKLMAAARLRKATVTDDLSNFVRIYTAFWPQGVYGIAPGLAHPILIYADLIATADGRNLEAARMLYESTITEYIEQD